MRPLPPAVCAKVISSEPSHRSIQIDQWASKPARASPPKGTDRNLVCFMNVAGGAVGRLSRGTDGCFGSIASIHDSPIYVRFSPVSDHVSDRLLCAKGLNRSRDNVPQRSAEHCDQGPERPVWMEPLLRDRYEHHRDRWQPRPISRHAQGSATFAGLRNRTTGDAMILLTSVAKPAGLCCVRDFELAKS
jgi:hypothetical protein